MPASHEPAPVLGETFLLMQPRWWDHLLSRTKTVEVRPSRLRPGRWFVGHRGYIVGYLVIGDSWTIDTDEQWCAHREQHCVGLEERPYTGGRQKCWANSVTAVQPLHKQVPYQMKSGAVGFCKYEPIATSEAPLSEEEQGSTGRRSPGRQPAARRSSTAQRKRPAASQLHVGVAEEIGHIGDLEGPRHIEEAK